MSGSKDKRSEGLGDIGEQEVKKQKKEEELYAEVTAHTVPFKKRTLQQQAEWEADLARLLVKQNEDYAKSIGVIFVNTQPRGFLDLTRLTTESRTAFLFQKYKVAVSAEGCVTIRPAETKEEAITGVYLGVLALQKISAVPIISAKGGTPEEHIILLGALLSVDYSIPTKRLTEIASGIFTSTLTAPLEVQLEFQEVVQLSQVNSALHEKQQGYEKPLSKAERRAELVAHIRDHFDAAKQEKLFERLAIVDAALKTAGKEIAPPAQARRLSWTQPQVAQPSAPAVAVVPEGPVRKI